MKLERRKIVALTAYDATFARALDLAGVDIILVGDSLGMVIQGHPTTLSVTMDHMVYHCQCVSRGTQRPFLIADLPFMSYPNPERAAEQAARLIRESGAQMVKLEGGKPRIEIIHFLAEQNIPVCGHLGLLPQSIHHLGAYSVQCIDDISSASLLEEARMLAEAGITMLVLECVPSRLGKAVSEAVDIPVIGIGAGPDCDGQILVLYDMLGLNGSPPRFVKNFLDGAEGIPHAINRYVQEVRNGEYPSPAYCY